MCGRFTQSYTWREVWEFMRLLEPVPNRPPRYNIAPTQWAAVVRLDQNGRRQLDMLRWGLIPAWAADEKIGAKMINARGETVDSKPAFRSAYRARRCLVPVDGYYEWVSVEGRRQPFRVVKSHSAVFALAGLWESWTRKGQTAHETLETFTIITTAATSAIAWLSDRMPLIVSIDDFDGWLALDGALPHCDSRELSAYPVSTRVNSVRNDDAACIEPTGLPGNVI